MSVPGVGIASYHPRRVNTYVANLKYAADVNTQGYCVAYYGALPTAAGNNIMNAVDIANIVTKGGTVLSTFDPDAQMGPYGRNVTVTLSGAGTPTVTVNGRDYLGQPMSENIVGTGAAAAAGKKAFKYIDNITTSAGVAATTLNLGTGVILGLPYAAIRLSAELIDDAVPTAGALVAFADTQTATSNDPRGTWAPASAPNGSRKFSAEIKTRVGNLYGARQFRA